MQLSDDPESPSIDIAPSCQHQIDQTIRYAHYFPSQLLR